MSVTAALRLGAASFGRVAAEAMLQTAALMKTEAEVVTSKASACVVVAAASNTNAAPTRIDGEALDVGDTVSIFGAPVNRARAEVGRVEDEASRIEEEAAGLAAEASRLVEATARPGGGSRFHGSYPWGARYRDDPDAPRNATEKSAAPRPRGGQGPDAARMACAGRAPSRESEKTGRNGGWCIEDAFTDESTLVQTREC